MCSYINSMLSYPEHPVDEGPSLESVVLLPGFETNIHFLQYSVFWLIFFIKKRQKTGKVQSNMWKCHINYVCINPLGGTWNLETVYLIMTNGDFETAKSKNFMERSFFLELIPDAKSVDKNADGTMLKAQSEKSACGRILKTHTHFRHVKDQVWNLAIEFNYNVHCNCHSYKWLKFPSCRCSL